MLENSKYCVKIQDLIDEGDLVSGLKDSTTGTEINPEKYIRVTVTNNKFNYSMANNNEC